MPTPTAVEPRTLVEVREAIAQKSKELHEIFVQAGDAMDMEKVTAISGDSATKAAEIKRRNDELTELGKKRDDLAELQGVKDNAAREHQWSNLPAHRVPFPSGKEGGAQAPELKGLTALLKESKGLQEARQRPSSGKWSQQILELNDVEWALLKVEAFHPEFKTLVQLSDINNLATRLPEIVPSAQETRTVSDLMLDGTTDNNQISYMVETTFTNAAAETAEAGTKPESALSFTETVESVRKIATWVPATDEILADVRGFESYLRARLVFMVARREEAQLISGDGIAPNLKGILNRTGIQTQALGTDPVPDAVYKAMVKVMATGFADPTGIVMHPLDWQDVRLLRTADGIYIWGSPADPGPERMWGLPVRVTTGITQNTGLVGAFKPYAQIFRREGITVSMSTEHSTYFIENKVAVLAEERLALAVYRPAAFCKVTGI